MTGLPVRSKESRRLIWAGSLALAALGLATVLTRAVAIRADNLPADDFTQDYVSAHAWTHDDDPYGLQRLQAPRHVDSAIDVSSLRPRHRNPHTPLQVLLIAPLSTLPYRGARTIWLVIAAGLTGLAVFVFAREWRWPRAAAALAALAALAIPVVERDLLYGQLGGPLLALFVLAWRDLRHGKETRAGIALGVASAIKLSPAFLIIPLLRRSQKRAAGWMIATAVALTGASMLILGAGATSKWLRVAAPDNFRFWRAAPVNIALPALPFRWLTHNPWGSRGLDVPSLATLFGLLLMGACAIGAFTSRARLSGDPLLAALPWMLLAGPLTGDLSLPLVLPALFVVTVAAFRETHVDWPLVAAMAVLIVGTPPGIPAVGPSLPIPVIVFGYGLPMIALLFLAVDDWLKPKALIPQLD